MCARRSRRRPPEIQAGLDRLKREMAGTIRPRGPSGTQGPGPGPGQPNRDGPMVSRLLELADRRLALRRSGGARPAKATSPLQSPPPPTDPKPADPV